MIRIIAALDRRGAIGRDGDLVFHLREDLRRFKALTMGATLVMGRKTFESLPGALPGRRNIVVTRQTDYKGEGIETAPDLSAALRMAAESGGDTFVIGGAQIYQQALPFADCLDLTLIPRVAENPDTFFPTIPLDQFKVEAIQPGQDCTFVTLTRRKASRK
ncbi:MAG: dihydrofolate reductase [Muribaculaceae bacterium]|nr:dihydrofolate reductase [Muribaculaceae bacterium]